MKIVGLTSSFREGRLIRGAIRSLEAVGLDHLFVYEGSAGKVPEGVEESPESELGDELIRGQTLVRGRWRSDARKRNEMLQAAKEMFPEGPVWGVWLDGDEVLANAEYLRDILQSAVWNDELSPGEPPTIRWPLWTVEADGSMAITLGRLVRLDLIRSYDISVSVVTNEQGLEEAQGNLQEDARLWAEMWERAIRTGRMLAWPPYPGLPHIVHRSHLRHPLRKGLRLHEQELEELRKAGKL